MNRCSDCGSNLPPDAQFCGQCGSIINNARSNISSNPASTILANDQSTKMSKPSQSALSNYSRQNDAAILLPWTQGGATELNPTPDDDEEEERRRRALLLGMPLAGIMADQSPAVNVPVIHGTPQFGSVPMVHGNPWLSNGPGPFAGQGFQNVMSTPAPQNSPAAPHTPPPNTGHWPSSHPQSPPRSGSSGHNPNPGGVPCGVMVLILAVICLIIIGTIGGLFFGLPPAISISGSTDVTSGGVLHLHGNNFVPGSSVTLTLDNTIPLFSSSGAATTVTAHSGPLTSSTLPMSLVAQFASINSHITARGNGTFDVTIPVSTNWSLGQHVIRAREDISSRSAAISFRIGAPAAKLVTKPSDMDFGKIEQGSKPVMSVVVSNSGSHVLSWQANSGNAAWALLQPAAGSIQPSSSPQFIYVTADTTRLKVGIYTATLHITSNGGDSLVNVKLEVVPPSPKPVAKMKITPNSLNFGMLDSGTQLTRTVTVSNAGTLALTWKASTANANWVTLDTSSQTIQPGARPDTVSVTVDTTNLTAGPQSAILKITSNGGNIQVPISVVVNTPTTTQSCTLQTPSVTSQSFSAQMASNPRPASQSFTIGIAGNCTGGVTLTPTATMASGKGWLAVTPSAITITSGSTTFSANVTSSALAPGTYTGTVSVTAVNAGAPISGSPQTVGITLTVTETPPVLSLSTSKLSFDLSNGDKASSQSFKIANTGGAPLNWTATLNASSFVSISSLSGNNLAAGANFNNSLVVNPAGVKAGTYLALVTINAVDPLTGKVVTGSPAQIAVTITITQAPSMQLSTQTLTLTPANCVYTATGTVTLTNTGGGNLGWNVSDPVYTSGQPTGWLTVSPSGLGSGDITLKFSADGTGSLQLGPTYTATVTITPSAGGTQTVTVSFTINCLS